MRSFSVDYGDHRRVIVSDGKCARADLPTPGFYVELAVDGDDFVYRWHHGSGTGSKKIPGDIMFDLPELLTILNVAAASPLFETAVICEQKPVAKLFER